MWEGRKWQRNFKKSITVDAVTFSPEEAEHVKSIYNQVYLFNLEEGLPAIPVKYDCILCSHLLEHIAYPSKLLKAIHCQLNDGGNLVVALPNLLNYKSRLQLLLGNFEYENQGTWDYTHLRWYTFTSAKRLLEDNGFYVEKSWVGGDIPYLSITKVVPIVLRKKIFKTLASLSPGLFGNQLIYVAKKNNK